MRTDGRDDANCRFLRTRLKVGRVISASRGRVHQFKDLKERSYKCNANIYLDNSYKNFCVVGVVKKICTDLRHKGIRCLTF
jgi:hypothetical protein